MWQQYRCAGRRYLVSRLDQAALSATLPADMRRMFSAVARDFQRITRATDIPHGVVQHMYLCVHSGHSKQKYFQPLTTKDGCSTFDVVKRKAQISRTQAITGSQSLEQNENERTFGGT